MPLLLALNLLLLGTPLVPQETPPPKDAAPPSQAVYHVPYHLSETKHLMIRAKLNGVGPFNFILDTGAPALFVTKEVAKKAGVERGADGWGTVERLDIEGGVKLEKIPGRIEEPIQLKGMNAMGLSDTRIDGVMGYNLLSRFRLEIDLTQRALTWTKVDYEPFALTRGGEDGKAVKPPPGMAAMEGVMKFASVLFARSQTPVVPRGFFGLELADESDGVHIVSVLPNSPAAQVGFQPGDRISLVSVAMAQPQPVRTSAQVLRKLAGVAPGELARFTLLRGQKTVRRAIRAGKGGL